MPSYCFAFALVAQRAVEVKGIFQGAAIATMHANPIRKYQVFIFSALEQWWFFRVMPVQSVSFIGAKTASAASLFTTAWLHLSVCRFCAQTIKNMALLA